MHYCRWFSRLQAKKVMPTDCSYKSTAQEFQLVFLGKPHTANWYSLGMPDNQERLFFRQTIPYSVLYNYKMHTFPV